METKVAKLESGMEFVQQNLAEIELDIREMKKESLTDFRIMFGALIAVSLGLAALMAKGFQWI